LEEVGKILKKAGDKEHWLLYHLAAETGLRSGEIEGLTPHDIVADGVAVRQTVWNGVVGVPKTPNALRTVAISVHFANELLEWAAARSYTAGQRLFEHSMDCYRKDHLHPLLRKLGIPKAGFHAFRHFNASLMDRLRIPLKTRQERLGHASSGSLTLDTYTHAEWGQNIEAANQMGDAIWEAVNSDCLTAVDKKGLPVGAPEALLIQ
jgi:integrase